MWHTITSLMVVVLASLSGSQPVHTQPSPAKSNRHVFVIVLENKNQAATFGRNSPATYLQSLRRKATYLPNYYGVTHASQGNYTALISGQGPSKQINADCPKYTPFVATALAPYHQILGDGCVYPASVQTLPDQLQHAGLTWGGYMEDMGNNPSREPARCGQPMLGNADKAFSAAAVDQYATRHNPFVYFRQLVDSGACRRYVQPLTQLPRALKTAANTSNYVLIVPNLCHDGHDHPCVNGEPGGLLSADDFLRTWVPRILRSPAYRDHGTLIITFDEAENDNSACCAQPVFPNTGQLTGGGNVGTLVLAPGRPATTVNTAYNHFSVLAAIEDHFGLPRLGYAALPGLPVMSQRWFTAKR